MVAIQNRRVRIPVKDGQGGRVQVSAELPLLYPLGRSKDVPEIRYPVAEEGTSTAIRNRAGRLEDKPYLQSLPVYRYRPAHRDARRR